MPVDNTELTKLLAEMKKVHVAGEREGYNEAVRTQKFIRMLHDWALKQLKKVGIKDSKKIKILTETKVPGYFKLKNVDILVQHEIAGPILILSVKSLMSSITNNFTNTYEGMIGDVIGLHERYPYLIMCHIFLMPKEVLKRKETYPIKYYARLLGKINGRKDETDDVKKYERIALLLIDFKKNPPQVVDSIPDDKNLRIESYFGDIAKLYNDRMIWAQTK
ncbi:hypothetical protein AUJ10_03760 [Candidatus Pacearchaeota archaeon CG1_02_31_27]|nr:MAG: hypothetical protein AUJ10_03760 [Candidatus Pacearchaeota archaeon CG1_02_31_27]